MNKKTLLSAISMTLLVCGSAVAQGPFGDRGGEGDRGERGGFRGGPPGGGGERGGGFRGGPPGGSGGRGGFDPASMLSRLDTNGNGVLDPDEQQGPAQFIISRMQQADPSIQPGKPIPLKTIAAGFERMRSQREEGGDDNRDPRSSRDAGDDALMPELLVPGFGVDDTPIPLLGFGPAAEMLSVPVTADDEREAAERLRRYDRDGDGQLNKDEMARFSGNPLDFDRNRDGKLSAAELAVRYARRREGEEAARDDRRDDRRDRGRTETVEVPDVFNGRRSYRPTGSRKMPEGLPGFFTDNDANGDGQVTMAEFTEEWNDEAVAGFFAADFNRDGVITADEALRSVEQGPASATMASTSSAGASGRSSSGTPSSGSAAPSGAKPDERYVQSVTRILKRYDKNGDSALTPSEWEKMLMSPADADTNRDGRVTIDEYALWLQYRESKR